MKSNKKEKKEKGITLIALVITIVILIILSVVTINMAFGDNGLVKYAEEARDKTANSTIAEAEGINSMVDQFANVLADDSENPIPEVPTFTTVTNAPDISGFNKSNTYYVSWNLTSSPYSINDTVPISGIAPSNWYDYTQGVNHWANIKTTGGGNDCYWVWIPRYAYKVPTKGSTAETIDIKFLKDDTNIPIGETEAITNTTPTPGNWVVHPAFTNAGNGGFGELTGIWVAKYEASSNASNVVENPTAGQLAIDGGSATDIDLKVRVKPNVTSWRNITVNNIFTVCQNLITTGNSLENTSDLDSHMMKNTEWGAVAYLSMSIYGKNSEVWNNPYYNNTTNYSPITGLCGNETNGKDNATTNMSNTVKYNEVGGENASTTGNVYGVYDMAGGAWEYVAGYLNEVTPPLTNYTTLYNAEPKYKDVYSGTSSDRNTNYNANKNKYGDAVYETSSSGNSNTGSWDSSYSLFPFSSNPVFGRGGRASNGGGAGVFAFSYGTGVAGTNISFRPVVLSSQP